MASSTPIRIVPSLYRRALKTSLDWTVRRDIWRPQALAIRQLFEANKDVRAPKQLKVILESSGFISYYRPYSGGVS
ncbi:hypothetical protein EYR41_001530 [Orbilia oligospora]|uniref:NADH dehydrogenase [ubiquinone] 1 beta subcomplex subunit 9 n=1 Tax=Orbilia oligospora TaxID=2813651 RepID=A0A7C8JXZ7_ORBOL|nr:hypothetical protein TWF751_001598 [Orbilia oligospora]TGJ74538.1 hypothetical protein EYR41_001530 [Orbilia oligospora]